MTHSTPQEPALEEGGVARDGALSSATPPPKTAPEKNCRPRASSRRQADRRAGHASLSLSVQDEMRILEALKANLTVHHETLDDPDLMMVLAESETSLLELLDRMLESDLDDDGLVEALRCNKDTLAVRLHRLEERRQSRRSILEQALFLLERKSLERPVATISLSERPPNLVVDEEAQIPARFFDLRPVLNCRLAKQALDAGEEIPGARLSNGCVTLTVRRR